MRRNLSPCKAPQCYERTLRERGYVIADFAARRERIRAEVGAAAAQVRRTRAHAAALLDEVTALTEWPVALAGRFEERFLSLPREVLISTLEDHQRYFPVEGANGGLLPAFIAVSNIESRDPDKVRAGNERVVRAAPRRCGLLLGAGPQAAARRARGGARCRNFPGQARLARRQDAPRARARRRHRRGHRWRARGGAARCGACASATC